VLKTFHGGGAALTLTGRLARLRVAVGLPSHEVTPFDQSLRLKLLIEHYS
jgi:hypothetical protein